MSPAELALLPVEHAHSSRVWSVDLQLAVQVWSAATRVAVNARSHKEPVPHNFAARSVVPIFVTKAKNAVSFVGGTARSQFLMLCSSTIP